jgi:hypothetical protein
MFIKHFMLEFAASAGGCVEFAHSSLSSGRIDLVRVKPGPARCAQPNGVARVTNRSTVDELAQWSKLEGI